MNIHNLALAEVFRFLIDRYNKTQDIELLFNAYKMLAAYLRVPPACVSVTDVKLEDVRVEDKYFPHIVVTFRCRSKELPLLTYVLTPFTPEGEKEESEGGGEE